MNRSLLKLLGLLVILFTALCSARAESPFIGRWALTIPGGAAGWLGIEEKDGELHGSLLWGGGSVLPVQAVKIEGDTLKVTRTTKPRNSDDTITDTITASLAGDDMKLTTVKTKGDGKEFGRAEFTGHRIPPVPPAPDLSKVKYGEPITLFNGKDLTGWRLVEEKDNGWSAQDGLLINRLEPGKHYGNLRTDREFEDFNLTLEDADAKGQQQRHLPARHLWIPGGGDLRPARGRAQHGRALQPHHTERGRGKADRRMADLRHHPRGSSRHRHSQRAEDHR